MKCGLMRRAPFEKTGESENQEAYRFDRSRQKLRAPAPTDSTPLQNPEPHNDGYRDYFYFRGSRENGKEMSAVFADDNGDRSSCAARGKPIAPTHDKTCIIPHRTARKIVLAAAARDGRSEFGHRGGTEKCIKSANDPDAQEEPRVRKALCNVARSTHNAGGDGIANGGSNTKPHAEHLQESSAAVLPH